MTINWRVFLTPEFLIGVVVFGFLINVVSAYVVRSIDWGVKALPASFRRAQEAESARIQRLTEAATADHALYAALAAEASRLRSHQVTQFMSAFICFALMIVFLASVQSGKVGRISGGLTAMILVPIGFFLYARGVDNSRRARRLDIALRQVQRNLDLPFMD